MFTGIYAPIATPFLNGEIDYEALKFNLDRYSATGLAGLVVLGSNGEFALLDMDEKMQLVEFVRQHTSSSKRIIAGTGCESTKDTIRLTRHAASVGACCSHSHPPLLKGNMTDTALEQYYTEGRCFRQFR